MEITTQTLNALRSGFRANYQEGLGMAASLRDRVATVVPSTTKDNTYGWLGKMPGMRKWLGDRVIHGIEEHGYTIVNEDYEITLGVSRNNIRDDNLGTYAPLFRGMGESVAAEPELMVWGALKNGFTNPCYDGQNFFDTDHPVLDENGEEISVANTDGGSGTPWFLLSTNRTLKPIIFQERQAPMFVAKDNPTDENVFYRKEFVYGTDARWATGYGFWQMAWGSKQTLSATTYATARAAMMGMKGDYGRPLGIVPNLLVVPPALEGIANKLINNEQIDGSDNEWKDTAEVLVVPWLA